MIVSREEYLAMIIERDGNLYAPSHDLIVEEDGTLKYDIIKTAEEIYEDTLLPPEEDHPGTEERLHILRDWFRTLDGKVDTIYEGKELIANALTEKGVPSSSTDTFATLADNISMISSGTSFQTDWGTLPAPQPINMNGFNIHILGVYNTTGTLINARSAITEIRFYNINDKDLINDTKPTAEYRRSTGYYTSSSKMFDGNLSVLDSEAYLSNTISYNEAEPVYKVSFPSYQEVARIEISIAGPMGGTGYYKGVIIKSKDGQTLFEDRDLRIENINQTLSFMIAKVPQNRNSMLEVSFLKSVGVPKAYIGFKGQVVVDINTNSIYLMDGVNPGGKLIGGEALVNQVEQLNQKIAYMEGRFNTLLASTQRGE